MKKALLTVVTLFLLGSTVSAQDTKVKSPVATQPPMSGTPVLKTKADSAAYAFGVVLGSSLKRQMAATSDLNQEIVTSAILAVINNQTTAIPAETAGTYYNQFKKEAEMKASEGNMKAGQAFLAENKKRKDVTTTASGLQYEVLKDGDKTSRMPTATSTVKVHYHGTLIDGTVFDSSVDRGTPIEFPLSGVIKGWTEGVQLMHIGDKFKFFIPYDLAYGERAAGAKIKPYSTLIFEVELLEIK